MNIYIIKIVCHMCLYIMCILLLFKLSKTIYLSKLYHYKICTIYIDTIKNTEN